MYHPWPPTMIVADDVASHILKLVVGLSKGMHLVKSFAPTNTFLWLSHFMLLMRQPQG